jgi:tetratricopeptide (TPR) repeat protein
VSILAVLTKASETAPCTLSGRQILMKRLIHKPAMKKDIKRTRKQIRKKESPKSLNPKFNFRVLIVVAVILIITFFSYTPSLNNEFTNWDDPTYVMDNQYIIDLKKENINLMFTKPVSLNYHPLTILSLAINYHYSRLDPKPYHTTNLIFHLLNTLLVFIFIYLLSNRNLIIPLIVSVLFGVHPMHVESVAWVSERKDVLYTFFYISSLIFYLKYIDSNKFWFIVLAFLGFILSLLSKAMAVTVPVVMLLLDYYRQRKFNIRNGLEKLPFFILSLVFGIIAIKVQSQGAIAKPGVLTIFQKIIFASYGFWMYLVKLVVPVKLSTFYPYPRLITGGNLPVIFYVSPVIALAIAGAVIASIKKTRIILFGFIFYFVTVALVLQFMPVGKAIIADRYTYIPYIGLFFIIAFGFNKLLMNENVSKVIKYTTGIIMAAFILIMAYMGNAQAKVWKNSGTLWTQVIENYPSSDVAYKNRGNFFGELRQTAKAMSDYNVLLVNNEADGQIYGNMGNIYRMREEYDKAYEAYNKAVEMDKDYPTAYINRGIINSILKKYDEALADFDRAMQLGAIPYKVIGNRAYTYLYRGEKNNDPADYNKAYNDFNYLVKLSPGDFNLYLNRGLVLTKINRYGEALNDFVYSTKLNPKYGGSYFNIFVCYYKLNDFKNAFNYAQQAKTLGYAVPDHYFNELKQKQK